MRPLPLPLPCLSYATCGSDDTPVFDAPPTAPPLQTLSQGTPWGCFMARCAAVLKQGEGEGGHRKLGKGKSPNFDQNLKKIFGARGDGGKSHPTLDQPKFYRRPLFQGAARRGAEAPPRGGGGLGAGASSGSDLNVLPGRSWVGCEIRILNKNLRRFAGKNSSSRPLGESVRRSGFGFQT